MSSNDALNDEIKALSAIYDSTVLDVPAATTDNETHAVLSLPNVPYSFTVTFPSSYPDKPPQITGTHHVADTTRKGEGEAAKNILSDVLGRLFTPGQVCLFDLIEEATPLLEQHHQAQNGTTEAAKGSPAQRSALTSADGDTAHASLTASVHALASSFPPPDWAMSEPLVVNRSTFIARCVAVKTLDDATSSISHLLAINKKVASATHNITAWRIKTQEEGRPEIIVQDSDDDGETAAGGRLLHLMQLMDVWNVVVIVTRWYGGVKLGPDRFRCINAVAREALVTGGFVKDEKDKASGKKGKK